MNWYVLCTKPGSEIKTVALLTSIGVIAFCPTYKYLKQYSDRKKKIEKPLISSYVFVKSNEKDRAKVFSIMNVKRYLFWMGKPAIVREEEIESLKKGVNSFDNMLQISELSKGNTIKIPNGLFKGINGEVFSISRNKIKLKLASVGLFMTTTLA